MKIIEHYFRYIIGHSQFELEHVWSLDAVKLITCKEQYLMDEYLDWATNQSANIKKKPNPQGYAFLQFKNPVCSAKTLEKDFRLLNWILAMTQTDFVRVDLTLCTSPRVSDLWKNVYSNKPCACFVWQQSQMSRYCGDGWFQGT